MSAPQSIPRVAVRHRRADPAPRLIVADAAVTLVERWKAELTVLRRRSPTSDAVTTLADCLSELVEAINVGQALTVRLTIAEARTISRIPVSTLRWLCKNKPDLIGAHKREGIWYIDCAHFERYLASPDGHATVPRPTTSETTAPSAIDRVVKISPDPRADLRLEPR